jgi:hypothetical protein
VPSPTPEAAHPAYPLPAYVAREQRIEPFLPYAHSFMADVDATLEQ